MTFQQEINSKKCKFHRFFWCNFLRAKCHVSPYLVLLTCTKSICTNFYYLPPAFTISHQLLQTLPLLTNFYTTFTNFYNLLLLPTNINYLLPTIIVPHFTNFYQHFTTCDKHFSTKHFSTPASFCASNTSVENICG